LLSVLKAMYAVPVGRAHQPGFSSQSMQVGRPVDPIAMTLPDPYRH
jgi:hypothetical protein